MVPPAQARCGTTLGHMLYDGRAPGKHILEKTESAEVSRVEPRSNIESDRL
jgi:hypothetical protein